MLTGANVSQRSVIHVAVAVAVLGAAACHPRTQTAGYGFCKTFPPDTVPLPPISVRATVDSPRVARVAGHAGGALLGNVDAMLDGHRVFGNAQRAVFVEVAPGPHRLRLIAIGYHARDTVVTMPSDSGLFVDFPVSRGGTSYCEDGEYEVRTPWWKFW